MFDVGSKVGVARRGHYLCQKNDSLLYTYINCHVHQNVLDLFPCAKVKSPNWAATVPCLCLKHCIQFIAYLPIKNKRKKRKETIQPPKHTNGQTIQVSQCRRTQVPSLCNWVRELFT